MNYELCTFEPDEFGRSQWESVDSDDLLAFMERESRHFFSMPILFRDEFGVTFIQIATLRDEDEDFAGSIVRNERNGFLYTTTDCEDWAPVRVRAK